MDDNKFDDILKGKLEDYPEVSFDPAALADLHYKMAPLHTVSWYSRHKAEVLTTAAVILILLLNTSLFWVFRDNSNEVFKQEMASLRAENELIDDLQQKLSVQSVNTVDTIYVESDNSLLFYEMQLLQKKISELQSYNRETLSKSTHSPGYIFLGKEEEIPYDVLFDLKSKGLIRYNGENVYLVEDQQLRYLSSITPYSVLNPGYIDISNLRSSEILLTEKGEEPQMSLETKLELERHYRKGVGIRVGPVLGASLPNYKIGSGNPKANLGVMADFILSPTLSLETGIQFNKINNEIDDSNDFDKVIKPGFDPSFGELRSIEIDSDVLELPINLKYRHAVSDKTYLIGSLGYSANLYTHQQFEYSLLFDAGNPIGEVNVTQGTSFNDLKFYAGTANFSLGVSMLTRKHNYFELSFQYKKGLGEMGMEQITPNFFGFRTAYWFHVR